MKLETPETRPFWSGQDTNNVAVSDIFRRFRSGNLAEAAAEVQVGSSRAVRATEHVARTPRSGRAKFARV